MDMNGKTFELTVRSQSAVRDLVERAQARLVEQRGQTAAEYLGVLVVIAVIIGALVKTDIGGWIGTAIEGAIGDIAGGSGSGSGADVG